MSDFLIYAARLQDVGVEHLSVRLFTGAGKERIRMMRVRPHGSYPKEVLDRWPWRDFELCGTDRVLEGLKDDLIYGDKVTAENVQAAIDAHPWLREDLTEWYADWLLVDMPTDDDIEAAAAEVSDADVQRSADRVKHMLHGLDIARRRDAMKAVPR